MKLGILILLSSFFLSTVPENSEPVLFKITNVRNTKGNVVLCFFNQASTYEKGEFCIRKEISKSNLKNGEIKALLSLPKGTYGVVLLDDENQNDEMDYGLLMPKEGFGFSNFVPFISKPSFNDFDFRVTSNLKEPVIIKVKYM